MSRLFPAPPTNPEAARFHAAAADGTFLLPRCTACGRYHWYPRNRCPHCFGPVEWREGSGRGTIYSFSVVESASPVFAVAYVTLEEGPTMLTNIVDSPFDEIAIGKAVRLRFMASDGGAPVPCFTLAEDD